MSMKSSIKHRIPKHGRITHAHHAVAKQSYRISSINSKIHTEHRKGLKKLLDLARDKKITDIAITTEDRLTRFGYEYITRYLTENGVHMHVLIGTTERQPEAELIDDFMALLASFSGRYYHLRNNDNEKRFLKDIENRIKENNNDQD